MISALLLSLVLGSPMQQHAYGQNIEDPEDIILMVQTAIKPSSWEGEGGPGTIYYFKPQRALIIRQTQENHEKIQELLEMLRRAGS